jgi:hypothetical protein
LQKEEKREKKGEKRERVSETYRKSVSENLQLKLGQLVGSNLNP